MQKSDNIYKHLHNVERLKKHYRYHDKIVILTLKAYLPVPVELEFNKFMYQIKLT